MQIPNFHTKEEKFKFIKDNKQDLIASKKYSIKHSDAICFGVPLSNDKGEAIKVESVGETTDLNVLKALVVINTTNILDSHGDVHIPGIWSKSLKELKKVYLLQEHRMTFDKIITDKVVASTKNYDWAKLGFPEFEGKTQALVFESEIDSERNAYMFEQYRKGYVTEHSVGMQYVNMFLCINSIEKYFIEEKQNWDKYISEVANKQDAINEGNFWAVTEAKLIEGSAVVRGSNSATPTLSVKSHKSMDSNKNIEFIDMMTPHHKAAIKMVNDFEGKVNIDELKKLMSNIKTAQSEEIELMAKIKSEIKSEPGKTTLDATEPLNSTQKQVESVYYLVNNLNLK